MILKVIFANSIDPDQAARSLIRVHTVCLYAKIDLKSLQEYSADDKNRRYFQMQVFLGILWVTGSWKLKCTGILVPLLNINPSHAE